MSPLLASLSTTVCQPVALGDWRNLLAVIWDFLSLSLFSLGGGNTLCCAHSDLPVYQYLWPSSRVFLDTYPLGQGLRGPSSYILALTPTLIAFQPRPPITPRDVFSSPVHSH